MFQNVSFVCVAFEVYVVDVCAFERCALDFNRKFLLFPCSLRVSAPHNVFPRLWCRDYSGFPYVVMQRFCVWTISFVCVCLCLRVCLWTLTLVFCCCWILFLSAVCLWSLRCWTVCVWMLCSSCSFFSLDFNSVFVLFSFSFRMSDYLICISNTSMCVKGDRNTLQILLLQIAVSHFSSSLSFPFFVKYKCLSVVWCWSSCFYNLGVYLFLCVSSKCVFCVCGFWSLRCWRVCVWTWCVGFQ